MPKIKISPAQRLVLLRMNSGWELGFSSVISPGAWLQYEGVGCGGRMLTVSIVTFFRLKDLGLIEIAEKSYPTSKYKLTKAGCEIL
jgi:hypothetical protein